MPFRRRATIAVFVAFVALGSSCSLAGGDAAAPTTTMPPGPSQRDTATEPFEIEALAWEACGRIECTTLAVPIDWADPQGPTTELAVARRPADDPRARLGTILLNPGGPGGSAVQLVRTIGPSSALGRLGERFDLVGFDPRGVGSSLGMDCGQDETDRFRRVDPSPDDADEQAALDRAARAVADACARIEPLLSAKLGTDQTVEDIETLRVALGDEQINWLGFSYGTFFGLRYADAFPDRVRAMVLDGVVDPSLGLEALNTNQARAFEEVLEDAGLLEQARRVLARVEADPLPARGGDVVGPAVVSTALVTGSYDASLMTQLARALDDAERGDGSALLVLAAAYWSFGDFPSYIGTLCADFPLPDADGWPALADRMAAAAPLTGAAVANEILPCAFWTGVDPAPPRPIAAAGVEHILVVGNAGDAATPIEQARAVADQLEGGALLEHDGTGHASFTSSPCVQDVVLRLFIELALPPSGTRC